MTNQLVLTGALVKPARVTKSPAGIRHLHLVLDHKSMQEEAKLPRQCFVRIQVVASGDLVQDWTTNLTVGAEVEVTGFLNRHETTKGIAKLVLHAQQLKKV